MTMSLKKAMIFAAGRGERMRPLTDTCPKPLLEVGGKPLIVWQIERLALGDGSRWGVQLRYSAEHEALETAGGIVQALPLLEDAGASEVFVAVSGDVYADFDYAALDARAEMLATLREPGMHLVMVPNPPFHPNGDFGLVGGTLSLEAQPRFTFGNIGLYDTRMFRDLPRGTRRALTPYYRATIASGLASGELYEGLWENVGTPAQLQDLDQRVSAR